MVFLAQSRGFSPRVFPPLGSCFTTFAEKMVLRPDHKDTTQVLFALISSLCSGTAGQWRYYYRVLVEYLLRSEKKDSAVFYITLHPHTLTYILPKICQLQILLQKNTKCKQSVSK